MNASDPTAMAAIHSGDGDVLGAALAQLEGNDADIIVLREAFEVPMTVIIRLYKATRQRVLPDFDYLGHVHGIMAGTRLQVRDFLAQQGFTADDLDWHSSPTVRDIGARYRVHHRVPCLHCGHSRIPILTRTGRPREYCSNACRQAAYRGRRANPADVAATMDNPGAGLRPCFAGFERRIPADSRFELIALEKSGAISMERITIDAASDARFESHIEEHLWWRRWSDGSPFLHAARAALAHLRTRGVDLDEVFLHGKDLCSQVTPYAVGFACRYLPVMRRVFVKFGGTEWIEFPRVSKGAALPCLRIRALDHVKLAAFERHSLDAL
ncbi:hypothetical protein ACFQ68_14070 [Amycolatopsis japonica]|uniref:hypothetical protein n=1 Tax=Amycolatopsis japonica TaxID=208439 RepID=UPI00366D2D68